MYPAKALRDNGGVWKSIADSMRFGSLTSGTVLVSAIGGTISCVLGTAIVSSGLHGAGLHIWTTLSFAYGIQFRMYSAGIALGSKGYIHVPVALNPDTTLDIFADKAF